MILIRDTREQLPLEFPSCPSVEAVVDEKLDYGDYRARFKDGSLSKLVLDRKGISDLYGTMTTNYDRFKRELERAKQDGAQLELIIEGTLSEVSQGFEHSKFEGSSMMKKLGTLWHRYHLYTVFCADRDEMAAYILWRFESEGYHKARGGK